MHWSPPSKSQILTLTPPQFEPHIEIDKPPKNAEQEEMFRKVKSLEQSLRNMQGLGNQVSVTYKDLCLFPYVQLPARFKMPKFDLYDGHGDPVAHLRGYCSKMRGGGGKDELLMAYFSQSLSGAALVWYTRQDTNRLYTWDDMAQAFAQHFQYNIDIVPDCLSLTKVEKKPSESFREYGFRLREQAARVNPPMKEDEMVEYFLQVLEPTYYGHLISAIGKSFNNVAIQSGTGSLLGKKKKDDVAMAVSGPWHGQRGHDIEKCWHLKRAIQELIDTNQILVQSPDTSNINQNPLSAHAETHIIEIVHKDGEPKKSSKFVMMIQASESNLVKAPDSTKAKPLTVEGATENEHRRVLMKILNEAHILDKITVNHLEKIASKIFEVKRITFSDDELPMEGTEHNRALYLTVKCEDSVVSRVLVDNGSSVNICPLSTLQKLKIGTERIHLNSVCVRGFDGGGKDSVGDIMLELSIGPIEFTMEFQVLDVNISYNLLLGRPWIHAAKAVPSSLHQMVKFEWDRQEIFVHVDEDLSACNDTIVPFIEAEYDKGPWVYQTFETVSVEKIPEGKCIPGPKLSSASIMVANKMLKNGFVSVRPSGNPGTFGLGFMPIEKDVRRVKNLKQKVWSLPKPVPHISKSFVKPGAEKPPTSSIPKPMVDVDEELIKRFQSMFEEVNMVEVGEGSSKADVQLVGPNVKLSNWENYKSSLKRQYNSKIIIQEVEYDDEIEYDEEAAFEEISKAIKQFEEKPKSNLSEIEAINLGDQDNVRETKISVHLEPQVKEEIIKILFEYKDVFAWSYDDMPGLNTDLVVHKLPTDPAFPPIKQKLRKFKTDMSVKIKEEITKQLTAKLLKKNDAIKWTDEFQEAFDKIKSCVLGQHNITGKKEQAIYYLSKKFTPYEVK
ncbi:uncharacterized protein [Nicotiana sylvestris]|uniref:uncharacterized protein n=1 Tax=Nicotiana sylvestris TaxID=4096 RepID=UPI00388C69FC